WPTNIHHPPRFLFFFFYFNCLYDDTSPSAAGTATQPVDWQHIPKYCGCHRLAPPQQTKAVTRSGQSSLWYIPKYHKSLPV
ncbi:hypothetical protein CSUI_005778, partial [Cystoisospora suis]